MERDRDIFEDALRFAIDAHAGMVRKSAQSPYILHPLEVATIVGTMSADKELLAAAVLHDVVEDTPCTLADIEERFGQRVAALVAAETEDKRPELPASETWRLRKEESLAVLARSSREVKIIWLGDKLSNMRSFLRSYRERGAALWEHFNQKDPAQQAWYYSSIAEHTSELSDELAWQEYDRLVRIVFEEELA